MPEVKEVKITEVFGQLPKFQMNAKVLQGHIFKQCKNQYLK